MRPNFKKILIISIFSVFITGIYGLVNGNFQFTISNDQNLKLEELKIKEIKGDKYAFKTKDDSMIEIGTDKESKPYLALEKWDGEVSLKVNIPLEVSGKPKMIGNKIVYSTPDNRVLAGNWWQKLFSKFFVFADNDQPKTEIAFYPREPEKISETVNGQEYTFTQNEYGGVEFDTILYEKPNTNQIVFPIETKGLKFFYQPPLHPDHPTWVDEDGDGIADNFRPENVVGSYAVYHEIQDKLFKTKEEAEKYKAGIAFHIYRPIVKDAVGNKIWGELNIDKEKGILAITINQDWLDNAVYPVIIDPNFGYETAGGSALSLATGVIYQSGNTYAPVNNGTVNSFSVYGSSRFGTTLVQLAIYNGSTYIDNSSGVTVPPSLNWASSTSVGSASISTAISYSFMVQPNDNWANLSYNTGADADYFSKAGTYGIWPNPLTGMTDSGLAYIFSIYCTYTAAVSAPTGYEMGSDSYRIWASSINAGGHSQTSTSYRMRDTIGEFVAGTATSTSYKLRMGYQPMLESYISLAVSTTSVQMLPNIGGVTGGIATGSYSATVITDNPAGYSLYVSANTNPALQYSNTATATYAFTDTTNNKAYKTTAGTDAPKNPGDAAYTEYTSLQYASTSADDTSKNVWTSTGGWVNLWYKFKINQTVSSINQINVTWKGYDQLTGGGDFELDTWNTTTQAWNQWYTTTTAKSSDQTYTKSYTSGFSDIIDSSNYLNIGVSGTYSKGASCPFIFPWDGLEYKIDNDIAPFLYPFMGEEVDYYRLRQNLQPRGDVYPLMIKDIIPEFSYYDNLELWTIDHPVDVDVWPNLSGDIHTIKNPQAPISCVDNNGKNCLPFIIKGEGYEGQKYYTGQKDDWMEVDFGDLSDKENLKLVIDTDYSINVQVLGDFQVKDKNGDWKTKLTISPHLLWATNVIDVSQWLPDAQGNYKIRFYFTQPHRIDYIGMDVSDDVPIKIEKLSLIKADHSKYGDVLPLVSKSDDQRTATNGYNDEEILLEFPYHEIQQDICPDCKRDFVFVTEGYYVQPDNYISNGYLSEEDYLELKKYGYKGPEDYENYLMEHQSLYENYVKIEVNYTSASSSFADYTLAATNTPDYIWSIVATTSEFGFSVEGIDITQVFKDDGSSCATSTQDTTDKCWYNFATTTQSVATRYSSNHLSGTQTTIRLQAQAGSSRMQEEGTYWAQITTTAVAN